MLIQELPQNFSSLGIHSATDTKASPARFPCGVPDLDTFLEGGLPVGAISEWGVPLGLGGRYVIIRFLAVATNPKSLPPLPTLWVYAATPLYVFPPAWAALGVDLAAVSFVRTDNVVRDLKPALLDPFYRLIVLDMPTALSKDDFAFLARQARVHKTIVLVLRNTWLKEERGNVWARLRINCRRDGADPRRLLLEVVRGLSPRRCSVRLDPEGSE